MCVGFCTGISDERDQVSRQDHPHLQNLASLLPPVVMHEHAPSTVKKSAKLLTISKCDVEVWAYPACQYLVIIQHCIW